VKLPGCIFEVDAGTVLLSLTKGQKYSWSCVNSGNAIQDLADVVPEQGCETIPAALVVGK
jgi:hypothetical protein